MRAPTSLSLLGFLVLVAGCNSQEGQQVAAARPQRDLALALQAPEVEIASAVELGRAQAQPAKHAVTRTHRRSRAATPARASGPSSDIAAVTQPVAQPVPVPVVPVSYPASDRELPPGKTVTMIPASSGPSTAAEPAEDFPTIHRGTMGGHGGGRCPGRGRRPGIGIYR